MDNIRNSVSRLKKDLKHRLRGRRDKSDRSGANAAGERLGSSVSLPQPEPRVAAGGHDGEGSRTNTEGKRREAGVDGKEVSQSDSRLFPPTGEPYGT